MKNYWALSGHGIYGEIALYKSNDKSLRSEIKKCILFYK